MVGFLVLFGLLGLLGDQRAIFYAFTGSMTLTLISGPFQILSQDIAFLKIRGGLDYYALQPISLLELASGFLLAEFGATLPIAGVALLVGYLLGMPVQINVWLLPALLLAHIALSAVGLAIGVLSPNMRIQNLLSQLYLYIVFLFAPVMIPPERLPLWLVQIMRYSPAHQAADFLRASIQGQVTPDSLIQAGMLAVGSLGLLILFGYSLPWRRRRT
ncbi:ABC transporter permease [bacterium]|nr:ABC transporter permease [bacterium]